MKRFLYYNQDSVNSFLAQIENGLLVKENNTSEKADSLSTTNGIKCDVAGDLSAKVLGIGAAIKGNIHVDNSNTDAATTLIRNVQEKAGLRPAKSRREWCCRNGKCRGQGSVPGNSR